MEAFTQLTIYLVALIVLVRLSVILSGRFGIPSTTIHLLIGILLGPSLFNLLGTPIILGTWGSPSPNALHSVLKILAEIGLIQLMFFAGLQTNWRELKTELKPIFSIGGWGFVLTAGVVAISTRWTMDRWSGALAVSAIMAASSFGISAFLLTEMKFLESRVSSLVLGVSVMSGLLGILLMIASLTMDYATAFGGFKAAVAVSWFMGKLVMFFAVSYFLMSRFLNRVAKGNFETRPRQMLIGYLLLIASLYAWGALHFGGFAAVGVASLGGALLGMSNLGLKEKIEKGLGSVVPSIFVGVLFVVFGMEVNFRELGGAKILLAVLFGAAVGAKSIGGWIAGRKVPERSREQFMIAIGILPQGEIGMLIAAYLFSRGLLNPSSFNIAITLVVMLTMLTPVLMKVSSIAWKTKEVTVALPIYWGRQNVAPVETGRPHIQGLRLA